MSTDQGSWNRYEKLVLHRLDTIDARLEEVEEALILVRIDLAQRKVKAGLWGALAGSIPALAAVVVTALS